MFELEPRVAADPIIQLTLHPCKSVEFTITTDDELAVVNVVPATNVHAAKGLNCASSVNTPVSDMDVDAQ